MSDVITGLRQVMQGFVAAELKSHTAKFEAMQKQMDSQHDSVMKTLDAFRAEMRAEFAWLKASNQMGILRQTAPLSERMAVVEPRLDQRQAGLWAR